MIAECDTLTLQTNPTNEKAARRAAFRVPEFRESLT